MLLPSPACATLKISAFGRKIFRYALPPFFCGAARKVFASTRVSLRMPPEMLYQLLSSKVISAASPVPPFMCDCSTPFTRDEVSASPGL